MAASIPFFRNRMKISGTRSAALNKARGRLVLLALFFMLLYILAGARLVDLTILQGELQRYAARGEGYYEQVLPAAAPVKRADITDRNGVLLARTLETASLYADPSMIPEPEKVARELVKIFPDMTYGDALQKLQRKGRFVWIQRNITPEEQYSVLTLGHPGLNFRTEYRRIYPQGPLVAHIAGYTDVDNNGLAGVERSFDKLLSESEEPLALSVDVRLQHILHRETAKAIADFSAQGGAGVIMDVNTGEVVAAVSLPDFDPNDPGASPTASRFNRVTLGVYELGSVFKIFSTAALLETQDVRMSERFDATESLKVGRFSISDYHAEKRVLTIPEVFMHSSNIGAALMGERVGTEALKNFYRDLGLLNPLLLEINETGKPLVPSPWREINTLTASYGHGIAVSPLHVATAAATIFNGGIKVQPKLVLDKNAAEMPENNPEVRIVSPQTAHRMRQLMRLTVAEGTGEFADVPGYRVGGKTGTAEKPGERGYDRKRLISSFLGVFPMNEPRYAVYIMVDEPKGTKASFGYATGGWVAAPAVKRVIASMAPLLGVEPQPVREGVTDDLAAPLMAYVHDKDIKGGSVASQ